MWQEVVGDMGSERLSVASGTGGDKRWAGRRTVGSGSGNSVGVKLSQKSHRSTLAKGVMTDTNTCFFSKVTGERWSSQGGGL
jgi:hypothetical protein